VYARTCITFTALVYSFTSCAKIEKPPNMLVLCSLMARGTSYRITFSREIFFLTLTLTLFLTLSVLRSKVGFFLTLTLT